MFEYNPKIDYLFSKKVIKPSDSYNQDESYYRNVYYKNITEIRDEKALCLSRMSKVIDYLKENDNLLIYDIKYVLNILDYKTTIKEEILNNLLTDIKNIFYIVY